MNSIITYKPKRDLLGRFRPSKRKLAKIVFVLAALVSFYGNYYLASQIWNVQCQVNGEKVGWFTTKKVCGEIAQAKFELIEADRQLRQIKEARAYEN